MLNWHLSEAHCKKPVNVAREKDKGFRAKWMRVLIPELLFPVYQHPHPTDEKKAQ